MIWLELKSTGYEDGNAMEHCLHVTKQTFVYNKAPGLSHIVHLD